MIKSTQKVVKVGSSDGITLPAKELRRENIQRGDEVEVTVRAVQKNSISEDQAVIDAAKKILDNYRQDFQNLAQR